MKEGMLKPDEQVVLRKHLERFVSLTDREFAEILTFFSTRSVKKDTVVLQPGDAVHHTFWVVKGLLLSVFNDGTGKEHIMQFATENCWITDQNGFYNQQPALFRLEALEDSVLLSLSYTDREHLCEVIPKMNHFFRRKANDSFVKQQKRLLTYMTNDAQERFDQLIREYPDLYHRVPKSTIAAYLGVSRETLSRFKKK